MNEITQYTRSENFKYLVIEAAHGEYYGFNTLVKKTLLQTTILGEFWRNIPEWKNPTFL
jgi:hypothetical protein